MNSQTSHPANHFHVRNAALNWKHAGNEFTKLTCRANGFESNAFVRILQALDTPRPGGFMQVIASRGFSRLSRKIPRKTFLRRSIESDRADYQKIFMHVIVQSRLCSMGWTELELRTKRVGWARLEDGFFLDFVLFDFAHFYPHSWFINRTVGLFSRPSKLL